MVVMSWRSKGVPLAISVIFIIQIIAPMIVLPVEELPSGKDSEFQSVGFTSGSGHELEGDLISVDGKNWTVRGESILDYWSIGLQPQLSDYGGLDLVMTEDGTGYACSFDDTDVHVHTIHANGTFETLLIDSYSSGWVTDPSDDYGSLYEGTDCAVGITNENRIHVVYNTQSDIVLARLAESNAVYSDRTWHQRTIASDVFVSGLTLSFDSESKAHIMFKNVDSKLHHLWFNKAFWNHTILDDGPIGSDIEVEIDSSDMFHIAYTNSAENEVRLLKFNDTIEVRQVLARNDSITSSIGMDLDSNNIEQITYSKSDGAGKNSISLLRSLSGKDTGRIDPDPKWTINYDDDSAEGLVDSGDFNGDGKDDLVYTDPEGNGTISIHYGSSSGINSLADRILVGSFSDSMLGTGIAVGDFNCDGIDDLASSEPGLAINDSGHISIRLGSALGVVSEVWWEMNGSEGDNLGWSLNSLGDVESDGCTDLAVVADKMILENTVNPTLSQNGMVVVFKGNSSSMVHHANITQSESGTMFGRQVVGNGDMNGDGFLDMVVSNTGDVDSPTGYSSLEFFYGNSSGIVPIAFNSHAPLDQGKLYGIEMGFVGDIHNDGYDDLLVSELFASTTAYHSGKVHIWEGSASGPIINGVLKGKSANALLGATISSAGDINEDGFDDFLLMSPSSTKSGKVEIYLGSASGPRTDVQLFAQGATGENVGINLLAGMDLNGDGMGEILYSSRDLTRGQNFGPVLTIMSERDWEYIDFEFEQDVIGIEMHTPLRGSPLIMTMLSDSSILLMENTPDGTPSGRWITRDLGTADVANIGISNSGKPLVLYRDQTGPDGNLVTLTVEGNTGLEFTLGSIAAGQQMGADLDSNGYQRLGHTSTSLSSIFYTEETSTGFTTTTVKQFIDLLHPIQMHVDSNDISHMVYVDDDDNMVRMNSLDGTWTETSILNTTIGDDFDSVLGSDDQLIFAQIAVSNNSTVLQVVEYHNNNTTVTDVIPANIDSTFELEFLDDKLVIAIMDSDKLKILEKSESQAWNLTTEYWLLGETEGHSLAMDGAVILFDANNSVQGLVFEDGNGSWDRLSIDIPDSNSGYELAVDDDRWHVTSTDQLDQMVWTTGTFASPLLSHAPILSTQFPAITTLHPVPMLMKQDSLMFAYSQSSTNNFFSMRFVTDTDRDLIPDSHDDKPMLGNQWSDSDSDGYGDNPLGPSPDECPSVSGTSSLGAKGCADYDGDGWADSIDDCGSDEGTSWWGRYGCEDYDQDGWSDNDQSFNAGDRFPTNWKQALDTDRDTFGDNHGPDCCNVTVLGQVETNVPDLFPYNKMQWEDNDNDGYGDNSSDLEFGDKCFWIQGFSWRDRLGCVDTDGDGSSDPSGIGTTREWTELDGADWWPNDSTQWADSDEDGFGDNSSDGATLPDKFPANPSAANDTDNDGYPNNWTALYNDSWADDPMGLHLDNCPDVAGNSTSSLDSSGSIIQYYGCTDSDGDGREDTTDAFPDDSTQFADSDDDGWGDNQAGTDPDLCPYEFGVFNGTNGQGCPIIGQEPDSDNDGIFDDYDACQDTGAGQEVDGNGCSDYQKDEDQDLVWDAEDMCPGTEIGVSVDSIGCSGSQSEVDSDGDGVNDPVDLCPNSNPELLIDLDGCNLAQKDTDGDGVTDLLDDCADTDPGIPVLANGCLDESALEQDLDGDGYKGPYFYNPDNDTHEGDAFPLDSTQWEDMDGDGYGDSQLQGALNSDACPEVWGNSTMKSRFGCLDSDGDGYHDGLGDDKFPNNPTQWEDKDLDNWGDNPDGTEADQCLGTSSAGASISQARINFGCSDKQSDSDNDGVNDFNDACPNSVPGADVTDRGCKKEVESEPVDEEELIMGLNPTIFITLAVTGGLAIFGLLFIIINRLRGSDGFETDDWLDEDDDEEDEFDSRSQANTSVRGPSRGPPGAASSRGPPGASRGPPSASPNRGPPGASPNRGPPGAMPNRGPPGGSSPSGSPVLPDSRGPARGKKVAKRKPIGDSQNKPKPVIDPNLFSEQELAERVAAVDWTKGALRDGEAERTILMQLQTTGWSAPQSRAIIDISKQ